MDSLLEIKVEYTRASRCWRSNNLGLCLQICEQLTNAIRILPAEADSKNECSHLSRLIWLLKIRCLSEDFYVNEALLLNEEDIEGEDQVKTFSTGASDRLTSSRRNASSSLASASRHRAQRPDKSTGTGSGLVGDYRRTAIVTGHMPSWSSRHASTRASSSYRPLTTSLTASQTAFSRSTRPMLKYASSPLLSKTIYEYLFNVQKINNCPDYRQCLEYLNNVQQNLRIRHRAGKQTGSRENQLEGDNVQLVTILDDCSEQNNLSQMDTFWLIAFGVCYFKLRMNKLAHEHLEATLKADHKQLDAYLWLIKLYLRQNEPIKVLQKCDEGLRNCRSPILYNWKARVQSLVHDSYAAHLSLKDSLEFYPVNIEALANVGHFLFYGGKPEQALKCFQRIYQLSINTSSTFGCASGNSALNGANCSSELLNNLALCFLNCGQLTKVVPTFQRAFLSSPSKEVTSDIWYNLSFVPLSFGLHNLAIACLNLALKNDSQNEEAINNLGVLKFGHLINERSNYYNRQEIWSMQLANSEPQSELANQDEHHRKLQMLFDEAETYFSVPSCANKKDSMDDVDSLTQPEMLFNMALLKNKRGQLMSSVRYCQSYLQFDQNNYMIINLLREIKQLVSHDW